MPTVEQVLARVFVDDIDEALPLYQTLSGTNDVKRFSFRDVELARVGHFLLLSGPAESLTSYQRVATLIVNDIVAAAAAVESNGGSVLEGPAEAPNGPRMIARHGDGAVFEYIELRQSQVIRDPFVQSLVANFEQALRLMEAALTDCPVDLWETDLWPDQATTGPGPYGGLHGSAPWFLAYHALSALDYDLSAEFEPWQPPRPFDENTYSFPNRMFTKAELLEYLDYCRGRVRRTLDALSQDVASRPLPDAHRYHGMLYGVIVGGIPLHVVEHASQVRQFLTATRVRVQAMPGDRGYVG